MATEHGRALPGSHAEFPYLLTYQQPVQSISVLSSGCSIETASFRTKATREAQVSVPEQKLQENIHGFRISHFVILNLDLYRRRKWDKYLCRATIKQPYIG